MNIELLGLSGVKIQTNNITIILSPPTKQSELPSLRMKADIIVLKSQDDKTNIDPANEKLFVIENPGEYESCGVFFYCLPNPKSGKTESILTMLSSEGINITHLGSLNRNLSPEEIEKLEGTDILLVPVGGVDVLSATNAAKLVSEIEPRIVIPMHYFHPKIKKKYEKAESFLQEIGSKAEPQEKLKITKKDLPEEIMQTYFITQ
jgi:L-ascorbate metabolism protein UlaG (beta-lactamase superfamily)